jgi:hypothetical protein
MGFFGCTSLNEIVFSSDSHLLEICGFTECISLCRIEIPSSVVRVGSGGFFGSTSLHVVMIRAGCRMRENDGLRKIRAFVVHESASASESESEDMKQSHRHIHQGIGGMKILLKE